MTALQEQAITWLRGLKSMQDSPAFFEEALDFIGNAALDDVLVRANHHPLAEFLRDGSELFEHTPAKEHTSCG